MLTAVSVSTQKEWDEVIKSLERDYYNSFSMYPDICISLKNGCYAYRSWYISNGYNVISFEEWKGTPSVPKPIIINVPKI